MRVAALAVLVVVAASGCGGGDPEAEPTSAFAYDSSQPLDARDAGVVDASAPIAVHDLSYASGEDRVEAFLAVPPGSGRRPAVLYLHPQGGDRASMLEAASWLAARGAVTMTISAPSLRDDGESLPPREALERFESQVVRDVVAARRALDLLAARQDVDPERLGVLGWSAGGRAAAIVAGADHRVRAAVLMAPGAAPVSEFVDAAPADLRGAVEETMTRIDPFAALADTRADVLVQAGRRDTIVPERAIRLLADAAPEGTELRWYDADHALDATAYREHLDWLSDHLDVAGPPVPGAPTGPR